MAIVRAFQGDSAFFNHFLGGSTPQSGTKHL
jgi:hypothetical protein